MDKFRLPRYQEIPNVGLFLEQVTKYLNEYLSSLDANPITSSMISNYVKMGLVSSPIKKRYNREQIASLFFICTVKATVSLENIHILLQLQQEISETERIYNLFCEELEAMLIRIQEGTGVLWEREAVISERRTILRNTLLTVASKAYLEDVFKRVKGKKKN